ncbi:short-chain dehydrogenase [Paucibacter aquatile]|uniref:Short-chain dehydrogenase n=1 Tax=Kinneretia aquatilis TaxID=2070761 RepID=A0A2N8KS08_9BURK|nr:short-chain dehydrogenase [Paucibacter aquatile]
MAALMNKVAIVTGASSGIGRAAALLFAREGARVLVAARREEPLQALVEEIASAGGQAVAMAGDVSDEAVARELVARACAQFGGLDVAFNNAGILGEMAAAPDLPLSAWEATLRTNLTSAFLAAKFQLPALAARGGGSLIFTSSFVGHTVGFPGMSAYAASKSGLIGLTQCLASEWGAQGIRVNALLPGGTDTPMGRHVANTPEAMAQVQGLHALRRLAHPDEVARSALYLASDASRFTTGTALLVDGGVSIHRG